MLFKKTILAATACLLLVASLALFTGNAWAIPSMDKAAGAAGIDTMSADQKIANQTGLGQKKFDPDKMPTKLDIAFTIGSVIAAIAAVKYL